MISGATRATSKSSCPLVSTRNASARAQCAQRLGSNPAPERSLPDCPSGIPHVIEHRVSCNVAIQDRRLMVPVVVHGPSRAPSGSSYVGRDSPVTRTDHDGKVVERYVRVPPDHFLGGLQMIVVATSERISWHKSSVAQSRISYE